MKVLLVKLVGVQMPEEFQMKQGTDHAQEASKKMWRQNSQNLKWPNVETGQEARCHPYRIGNCVLENGNSEINLETTVDNLLNMSYNKML